MEEAQHLADTLSGEHNVALRLFLNESIPPVAVAETVLKQIVLNLTTTAICSVSGGTVYLACEEQGTEVIIQIKGEASPTGAWQQPEGEGLSMARRLVKLFDGRLSCSYQESSLTFQALLPSARQIVVLAVEDNVDTLQLWERYLKGTRFHFVGIPDPSKALEKAVAQQPELIVLDVMMPEVDGWELLGQLHNHPATSTIPIIVCTVLPQEELALSLGASDFIRKPVTRRSFRAVLKRQSEALAPA
jgi:CheY-like chemotaxis protein